MNRNTGFNRITAAMVALTVSLVATKVRADGFSFTRITHNSDLDVGSQLRLELLVPDHDDEDLYFIFSNLGPVESTITRIFFDWQTDLFEKLEHVRGTDGVRFWRDCRPRNLPGGNTLTPEFDTDLSFSAVPRRGRAHNGIDPGEKLGIEFELEDHLRLDDVIQALEDGSLRIGVHVQGLPGDASDSYLVQPMPEPAELVLLVAGVAVVLGFSWRLRRLTPVPRAEV